MKNTPSGDIAEKNIYAVEMKDITKRFYGLTANDSVDFSASWGNVHAVIGENGAGKSTLMKILYGMCVPDSGSIRIDGREAIIRSPQDAIGYGIGMVHQQFMLVKAFTALENIILGCEPKVGSRIDIKTAESNILDICAKLKIDIDLRQPVSAMSVSAMQKTEIVKALYRNVKILILDEPTSVLSPQDSAELFRLVRQMAAEGMCVLLISHKLEDVMEYADRITVLRRGKNVFTSDSADTDSARLVEFMMGAGKSAESIKSVGSDKDWSPIMRISDLSVKTDNKIIALKSVNLEIFRGEILGIAGVDGNGQRELAEALIGLRKSTGHIEFDGKDIISAGVMERMMSGMLYIPENHNSAVIKDFTVNENAILGSHTRREFYRYGLIDESSVKQYAEKIINDYDINMPSSQTHVRYLSGGNMQKLILGRAFSSSPKLLIVSQPTRGLDINASASVYNKFIEAAENETAIILISHDLDEIMLLASRIAVMYKGSIVKIFNRTDADKENVGAYMVGAAS